MAGEIITTFPQRIEYEKAVSALDEMSLSYEVVSPEPGYSMVGCPAIALAPETRRALSDAGPDTFTCSGWVEYRTSQIAIPEENSIEYQEDIFGIASIMLLAPCVADPEKIRIIAHISGDLSVVFPYMNVEVRGASYNKNAPNLTFMDGYRMISLYPHRIAVAKPDDIVDAWRVLEMIRQSANDIWSRREMIVPDYTLHARPPALEIFKRLPRTNCRECGEMTCLAFASKIWLGQAAVDECAPVFRGDFSHLKDALLEICQGLGTALDDKTV